MCRNPFIKTLELSKLLKHQGQKTIVRIAILILVLWVCSDSLIGKDLDARRDWGQEEEGMTEDEMAGWHHRLDGHEFE